MRLLLPTLLLAQSALTHCLVPSARPASPCTARVSQPRLAWLSRRESLTAAAAAATSLLSVDRAWAEDEDEDVDEVDPMIEPTPPVLAANQSSGWHGVRG